MDTSPYLRLSIFGAVFVVLALAECIIPRNPSRRTRWIPNLLLAVCGTFTLRICVAVTTLAAAAGITLLAQEKGWGLFNLLSAPAWVSIPLAWLALDLVIYIQHRAMHRVPVLWRMHKVHHTDTMLDLTTALRFHPLEILFSMGVKIFAILIIGPPLLAVLLFEILLNAFAMFNHSNLRLPPAFDKILRLFIITPAMHQVHHAPHPPHTNKNFGFSVSLWDYLFRSYAERAPTNEVGLAHAKAPATEKTLWLLLLPFFSPNHKDIP